ncbi:hypothetical protein D3C76_1195280 [compost metagenome]
MLQRRVFVDNEVAICSDGVGTNGRLDDLVGHPGDTALYLQLVHLALFCRAHGPVQQVGQRCRVVLGRGDFQAALTRQRRETVIDFVVPAPMGQDERWRCTLKARLGFELEPEQLLPVDTQQTVERLAQQTTRPVAGAEHQFAGL